MSATGLSTGHPLTRGQEENASGCRGWRSGWVGGVVVPGQTQKKAKQSGGQSAKINIKGFWPSPALLPGNGHPPYPPAPRVDQARGKKEESEACSLSLSLSQDCQNFLWNLLHHLINESTGPHDQANTCERWFICILLVTLMLKNTVVHQCQRVRIIS